MVQLEVTGALIQEIKDVISQNRLDELDNILGQLFPADVAEIFYDLEVDEAILIFSRVDREKAVNILRELDEELREKILSAYTSKEISTLFIEYMDSDDAVDIINELSSKVADEVISHITDIELSKNILSLLHYDEDSAGGLMAKELIKVDINWTVSQCVEEIRKQAENVTSVHSIYVVDDQDVLKGLVSLKSVILAKADTKVSDIYNMEVHAGKTHNSGEEIANMMNKYDLVALPIVDALDRLVGRITIDDVVDFMKEEADKDYQLMSGISENVESTDKVWILSRSRLPWLLIGLLGGIANSRVIGLYEGELVIHPQMAFFMPLVAAMGGNAGVQSSAIIVQGLAHNSLGTKNIFAKLAKESSVALLNGLICSIIILAYNLIIGNSYDLSFTVSIALISVIIFASVLGTVVPLLLDRMEIDPALATGPFITTTNDLLGLSLYFIIGKLLMNNI